MGIVTIKTTKIDNIAAPVSDWTIPNQSIGRVSVSGNTINLTGGDGWYESMWCEIDIPDAGSYEFSYDYSIPILQFWSIESQYKHFGLYYSNVDPNTVDEQQYYLSNRNGLDIATDNENNISGHIRNIVNLSAGKYWIWFPGGVIKDFVNYTFTFTNIVVSKIGLLEDNYLKFDNCILKYEPTNEVRIGSGIYKFIQIDNLYWLTENLHEELGNVGTWLNGSDSIDYMINPNKTNSGYYYQCKGPEWWSSKYPSIKNKLEPILPDGWRLPTISEIFQLYNKFGISFYMDAISTLDSGNDTLEIGLRLTGYVYANVEWYMNEVALMSNDYQVIGYKLRSNNSDTLTEPTYSVIRLVKDLT